VRITVFASGSRGDVQPFVALAMALSDAGHEVLVAAPKNFRPLVETRGVAFHPFSVDVDEVMRSDVGRSWLGHSSHSPVLEVRLVSQMVEEWAEQMAAESIALAGTADVFVSGVMTLDVVDALVQAGGGRHVIALLSPFHASRDGNVGLQSPRPGRISYVNRLAGVATEGALAYGFGSPGVAARRALGLPLGKLPRLGGNYRRALRGTPTVVGASTQVVPPPADWPQWVATTGYWHLPALQGWEPDPALANFLAMGERPWYVGFGSMSTRDPGGTLDTIASGLRLAGRRGVVHSGGADLGGGSGLTEGNDHVLLVDDVPHDWLFPQVAGVVHHGGAGTTAAGLRAGVPTGVVPHIGDQPYWGRRVCELGLGAEPVPRHRFTAERLARMISEMSDPHTVHNATAMGVALSGERGPECAVGFIERWL
jgi:sterol 3beta-glucosyltransferase